MKAETTNGTAPWAASGARPYVQQEACRKDRQDREERRAPAVARGRAASLPGLDRWARARMLGQPVLLPPGAAREGEGGQDQEGRRRQQRQEDPQNPQPQAGETERQPGQPDDRIAADLLAVCLVHGVTRSASREA